jgi:hypothetical protein
LRSLIAADGDGDGDYLICSILLAWMKNGTRTQIKEFKNNCTNSESWILA